MYIEVKDIKMAEIFDKLNIIYAYLCTITNMYYIGKSKAGANRVSQYIKYGVTAIDNNGLRSDMEAYIKENGRADVNYKFKLFILAVLPAEKMGELDCLAKCESYYVNKYLKTNELYNDMIKVKYEINDFENEIFNNCIDYISNITLNNYDYISLKEECFNKIENHKITIDKLNISQNMYEFIKSINEIHSIKQDLIDKNKKLINQSSNHIDLNNWLSFYKSAINKNKVDIYDAISTYIKESRISEFNILIEQINNAPINNIKVGEYYIEVPVICKIYPICEICENSSNNTISKEIYLKIYYNIS